MTTHPPDKESMLTTTQIPGVGPRPQPCWTILNEAGEGVGYEGAEYHYDSREKAEQDAATYTGMTVTVTQHEFSCWTATLLCGEPFIYEGDDQEQHFADEANLLNSAEVQGNLLIPGKGLACDASTDCAECAPERRRRKQELAMRDTHPDVFIRGLIEGWAEDIADPTEIDWNRRRATSLMRFMVEDGRPVNTWSPHLPYGRGELGHWGEKANADAIVFAIAGPGSQRYILLGDRDDGNGWALPGGGREGDETPLQNALRELREETLLAIDPVKRDHQITVCRPRHVEDPRESREAWMVTVPVIIDLGRVNQLPTVHGSDDLIRAAWVPCDARHRVDAWIEAEGGKVFPAHDQMITAAIYKALR